MKKENKSSIKDTTPAAQKLFKEACTAAEAFDGQDPRYATSLNNLGNVYFKEDFYRKQRSQLRKRSLFAKIFSARNGLPVADSMNDLAMVYFAENKSPQAEPLLNKALSIPQSECRN